MTTLSVAIATYNEESNIKRCLDSVKNISNEIIIVDGNSSDRTVSIAKKYPKVKVISTSNKSNFHINKQMAIEACSSDWILQLDADETISHDLLTEIVNIINSNPSENGFWINRRNFFLGKFLCKGGVYPDSTIRLYRRNYGKLPCKSVHEQAEIKGNVGFLKNDLLHFADISFSKYLLRNNRYTSLIAQELKNNNIPINFYSFCKFFFLKPAHWFLLSYFFHRGYVDGFPGFVFSWYSSLRFPISFIKYYEFIKNKKEIILDQDWD